MAESIKLKLNIDSRKGTASIKKTSTSLKKLGTAGSRAANKLSKGFIAAAAKMKLLAVGIAAGTTAIGYMAKKTLDSADATIKLSNALGFSVKSMQEYSYAAGLSGVSQSVLNSSMLAFTKRVGEAKAGTGALVTYLQKTDKTLLKQLTSATDVNKAFEIMMYALGDIEDVTKRNALASAAFSRAGVIMTLMVKDGGAALRAMMKEANDLGLIMGKDLYNNAEKLNDSMSKVSQVIKILFTKAVLMLSPEIFKVTERMKEWVIENQKLIDQTLDKTIKKMAKGLRSFGITLGIVIKDIKTITYIIGIMVGTKVAAWCYAGAVGIQRLALSTSLMSTSALALARNWAAMWLGPVGIAATFGVAVGTILNRLDVVKAAAQHTINGIVFAWSYSFLKIQLAFYKTIEKIKIGWASLKSWFMETFPKMAQYLEMEKSAIKHNINIARVGCKVKKLKETYKELEEAINNAYSTDDKGVNDKDVKDVKDVKSGKIEKADTAWLEPFLGKERMDARKKETADLITDAKKKVELLKTAAEKRVDQEKDVAAKIRAIRMEDKIFALADLTKRFEAAKNYTDDLIGLEKWRASEEKKIRERKTDEENAAYEDMKSAMMGWANGFSATLADMMLGAEVTFESILKSFLKMVLQMAIQMAIVQPMFQALGWIGAATGAVGAVGGASITGSMGGNQYYAGYAKGGVFPGGISGYSNQVVNRPTQFAFAHGAGLMGEAGPEAIMPLTRGANGDLGVKSNGGKGDTNIFINAIDTRSFAEVVERNPGSIISVIDKALINRTPLLDTMRATV